MSPKHISWKSIKIYVFLKHITTFSKTEFPGYQIALKNYKTSGL
jgi:hypothetical protein